MTSYFVITSEKNTFENGQILYKVWIQNDNNGLCYIWSKNDYKNGDQIKIGVRADKNNRASLYIIDRV